MFNLIIAGFLSEMEKNAEKKEPSWWQKQKGINRAMRRSDKGIKKILAKDELIGSRVLTSLKHGLIGAGIGAIPGAAAGALASKGSRLAGAGLGALVGGAVGGGIGDIHGTYSADKKYLMKRGIKPTYLGLSSEFSPAARKKYIDKYEK